MSADLRESLSRLWAESGEDLTREERLFLIEGLVPPNDYGRIVLAALRSGYERGRRGGPR